MTATPWRIGVWLEKPSACGTGVVEPRSASVTCGPVPGTPAPPIVPLVPGIDGVPEVAPGSALPDPEPPEPAAGPVGSSTLLPVEPPHATARRNDEASAT